MGYDLDDDIWDDDPFPDDYEGKTEPDCFDCCDQGSVAGTPWCPGCHPSPRMVRRARHREWQRRDRLPRQVAAGLVVLDEESPF